MHSSTLLSVLLPALSIAHPSIQVRDDTTPATLYKSQNLLGGTIPAAELPVPASYCVDLSNVYGSWEGEVRSLIVYKGWQCCFHAVPGCPTTGPKFTLGSKTADVSKKTLGVTWDRKIMSVYCEPL
ncbi:hypothetical protein BDV96DRAFT_691556 [Lophiotrema nucula]|uniref:Uncharacterized protein n=1 Tax=Lophiotrema nucula TaxID=690887 RepID=A0A6A5YTS5_9PLEO|nr:hypothetical protein BDV96DRAFT_691556 [Lophiotrema nucula]